MNPLNVAIVGDSKSFPLVLVRISEYGYHVCTHFYSGNIDNSDIISTRPDVIFVDDYTLHEDLFIESETISFEMTGSTQQIKTTFYNGIKMIGFPTMDRHHILSLNNYEEAHRLNYIMGFIKQTGQQQR